MKAVILCGGLATRMLPITKSVPKEILPVLNRPIIEYLIDDLVSCGIESVLIVTNRGKESIENYFDKNVEIENRLQETGKLEKLKELKNISDKCKIYFIRQITPLGTAHALLKAKDFVGDEDFVFLFGDELMFNKTNGLTKQLLDRYNKTKSSVISVSKCEISESYKYGMLKFDKNNKFEKIVEKPKPENSPSDVCFLGNSVLSSKIFDYIKLNSSGETGIVDAINDYAKQNLVEVVFIEGERFDVGNKLGFIKANVFYGLNDDEIKNELKTYLKTLIE